MSDHDHFQGKSALHHLKEARERAARETESTHGLEAPGHLVAGADSAKTTALLALLFWIIAQAFQTQLTHKLAALSLFFVGWLIFSVCRSAIHGWSRLSKLNRVITEEKDEIATNREQEKEELTEMYRAKGFHGELLENVIDVLMADDNRLLNVMLEEELGLSLETYEHPLKQAFGALVGTVVSAAAVLGLGYFFGVIGVTAAAAVMTAAAAYVIAMIERGKKLFFVVWHLASLALSALITFFITKIAA